jgi:hypothetical protein
MIGGMHTILYSKNADSVRAYFRDVLKFPSVDAGHGWLIFAAPPAEIAVHPTEGRSYAELYLMSTDIERTVAELKGKGVEFVSPITVQRWGLVTQLKLPDGELLGLYEPKHPLSIKMKSPAKASPPKLKKKKRTVRKSRTKAHRKTGK